MRGSLIPKGNNHLQKVLFQKAEEAAFVLLGGREIGTGWRILRTSVVSQIGQPNIGVRRISEHL